MNQCDLRVAALRRFAIAITVLNVLGHTFLGFEQSFAYLPVALTTAYVLELVLETISARNERRVAHYRGGTVKFIDFLLPAHISGLACAMLLYSSERLWPIAFAVAVAVGSKYIFRVQTGRGTRHALNPSNVGVASALLAFPWVGIAPPYQFTENITGVGDWMLVAVFVVIGSFLNVRFTQRMTLIVAWLVGFLVQALVRSWLFGTPVGAALHPMSGVAFLLFTFYMISDPGTTPSKPVAQVAFGAAVALFYGVLTASHIVFGLFFALLPVCVIRGVFLHVMSLRTARVGLHSSGVLHGKAAS